MRALSRSIRDAKEEFRGERGNYSLEKEEAKRERERHERTKLELVKADDELDEVELDKGDMEGEMEYLIYESHRKLMEERDRCRGVGVKEVPEYCEDIFETQEEARERNRRIRDEDGQKEKRREERRKRRLEETGKDGERV